MLSRLFDFFESLIPPFPAAIPQTPPKNLLAFCWYYARGAKRYLIMMAILSGLIAVMEVSLFGFLGKIVDWLSEQERSTFLQTQAPTLLKMSAMLLIALPLVVFLHSTLVHQTLMGNFPMRIRWQAHRYLLRQPLSFFQNEMAGRIATKVMQTSLAVRETIMKVLDILMYVIVYFLSTLVLLGDADLWLMLPMLAWLAAYIGLLAFFIPRLGKIANRQADKRSLMTGRLVDTYTNILTVKLFSHSQREDAYAKDSMQQFLDSVHPQMRLVTQLQVCLWSINALLIFAVAALSIGLWLQTLISVGVIAIAVGLVLRMNGMSQWIMWEVSALFENIGTAQDGLTTLSQENTLLDQPNAPALQISQAKVEFRYAQFRYHTDQPVADGFAFQGFNLTLAPGEKIGLVGRSGAGKSTLVNLLLRFYDLQGGEILIDGQSIAQVQQESVRQQIAMVTQDTALLHRSVRDNILYGNLSATEAQMREAARLALADDFIQHLQDGEGRSGYDAYVGERGVKLSGGQRQRIAIARALLKNAPILILDEATSALDSEAELAIQANLQKLMQGKTVIAIAHRLSTIAMMDRLVVIDQGHIVETGTHSELLRKQGIYAQLWSHQSGGFIGAVV
jgi:ATP-binding cassette subfamily B multidrug efflux pump